MLDLRNALPQFSKPFFSQVSIKGGERELFKANEGLAFDVRIVDVQHLL